MWQCDLYSVSIKPVAVMPSEKKTVIPLGDTLHELSYDTASLHINQHACLFTMFQEIQHELVVGREIWLQCETLTIYHCACHAPGQSQ